MTCNVYVSIANEYRISEVIQVEVTNSHITVDSNLVQLQCQLDSLHPSYGDMKMHVDSLEVRLCGRSLPTSCVWGNYSNQLALRRTAAAPLSSASSQWVRTPTFK